ncbi:MAG: Fur family transcriptional regulator [Lachnospirales bacterium]
MKKDVNTFKMFKEDSSNSCETCTSSSCNTLNGRCKENIIGILKENGMRITSQRLLILDIIIENSCSSTKEIYYLASKVDDRVSIATVYRFITTLENVGILDPTIQFDVSSVGAIPRNANLSSSYKVYLKGGEKIELSKAQWNFVIEEGLKKLEMISNQKVSTVVVS